jgi:transposase
MGSKRRRFTQAFKDDAVRMVQLGGRSITEVAKSVDVHRTLLSGWVHQAEIDQARPGATVELTSAEKEELTRLRRENKQLKLDTEFLKKTAAYFARDSSKGST